MALIVLVPSCGRDSGSRSGRLQVAAAFSTVAELARGVGGEHVDVVDLTPAGAEPHDVELRSSDVDAVERADVLFYLGGPFQPSLNEVAKRSPRAVDLLRPAERSDPHIWLDPRRWAEAVEQVERALSSAQPEGRAAFRQRASGFGAELERLDADYAAGLRQCGRRLIVTSHRSFGPLARRYGLEHEAVTGLSPESEPDPRRLAELADLVRRRGVTTVFAEPLVADDGARTLARDAGVAVAVLDPLEGEAPGGYLAAMRRNLAALRSALGCT